MKHSQTTNWLESEHSDTDKLNRMHHELGALRQSHGRCRKHTLLFGAIGGILLALSSMGSFHYVVSQETDWSKNPDSPVYQLALETENGFRIPIAVLMVGFLFGIGMFYKAREYFNKQEHIWIKESLLILEIRELQNALYPRSPTGQHPHSLPLEHASPLEASDARGEYLGVYSPPPEPQRQH